LIEEWEPRDLDGMWTSSMDGGEGGEVVKVDKVLLYKVCTLGWEGGGRRKGGLGSISGDDNGNLRRIADRLG